MEQKMWSGQLPSYGFSHCTHIRHIKITNDHGVPLNISARKARSSQHSYNISPILKNPINPIGKYIFFEGLGGNNPNCVF